MKKIKCLALFAVFAMMLVTACKKDPPPPTPPPLTPASTSCIGELNIVDPPVIDGKQFDLVEFETFIRDVLINQAVGFQYSISSNGVLMRNKAFGLARIAADGERYMQPCSRMNIASVSKTITAVGVLKLMEQNQIFPDDTIGTYLPAFWTRGPGVSNLTFRDLLTHNTGFRGSNMGFNSLLYDSLQNMVAAGTGVNLGYLNANFALFRIIIPGILTEDKSLLTESYCNQVYRNYINEFVLNPVGISNAGFTSSSLSERVLVYNYNGGLLIGGAANPDNDGWEARSGGGGWCLSAIDLNRLIDGMRFNDSYFSPANRQLMQSVVTVPNLGTTGLGIYPVNTVVGSGFWHNGGIAYGGGQGYTSVIIQFPGGINASLIINSINSPNYHAHQVLLDAFNASWN